MTNWKRPSTGPEAEQAAELQEAKHEGPKTRASDTSTSMDNLPVPLALEQGIIADNSAGEFASTIAPPMNTANRSRQSGEQTTKLPLAFRFACGDSKWPFQGATHPRRFCGGSPSAALFGGYDQ